MENKEKLSQYLKELPVEKPSANFTELVMNRVRLEPVKENAVYQPLISWQVWWRIFIGFTLLILGTALFYAYFPAGQGTSGLFFLDKIDLSLIIKPFSLLTMALSKLSFTYIVILAAITVLLFFDRFYSLYSAR